MKAGKTRTRIRSVALLLVRNNSALSITMVRIVQKILNEEGLNLLFGHVAGPEDLPPAVQSGAMLPPVCGPNVTTVPTIIAGGV